MIIALPKQIEHILDALAKAGFEAYAVGGCIRDSILGREPEDWDVTTSAKPGEVKTLFPKTVDTGIAHGTVTVMDGRKGFEVTTYRIDGKYEDSRHPKEVTFTPSLLEDLKRRDFTMNAMAYNPKDGLVDLFDGMGDIRRKTIRCVGDAKRRFGEDALRMMRAVRFAAQLGFAIEPDTREAICKLAPDLARVSAERVQAELVKLLLSDHPEQMRELYETGITKIALPEFDAMMRTEQNNPHHMYTVGEHTIHALEHVKKDRVLRLAVLLHDVAKPLCRTTGEDGFHHFHGHPKMGGEMSRQILRRLKFDNDTVDKTCRLVAHHDDNPPVTERSVRQAIVRTGIQAYPDIFEVKRADILAQSDYKRAQKLEYLDAYEACYRSVIDKKQCLTLKDLAVTGGDLIAAGMRPGPQIGAALKRMLEIVLKDPEKNVKEYLMAQVK